MINPYPHQSLMLDKTREKLKSHRAVLLVGPTGIGKGTLASIMLAGAEKKSLNAVFAVHRVEIVDQIVKTLSAAGVTPGVIAAGYKPDYTRPIQVASLQTLTRRLDKIPAPALLVADEAQHIICSQWRAVCESWATSKIVGLTATPCRLDGRGLGEQFTAMVLGPDVRWLIDNKYLAEYKAYAPNVPDTSSLHIDGGDYSKKESAELMRSVTGDAVKTYLKNVSGKQAICFCVSVEHSKRVAAEFVAAGVNAVHVDGDTDKDLRRDIMDRFRAGDIQILTNVDIFTEGVDCPGVEVGIFLRPTASMSLWRQMVGRVLRYQPEKIAYLFDHAGNFLKHGLPDDEVEWSLEGVVKKRRDLETTMAVRACKACYAVSPGHAKHCEDCGVVFPLTPREIKEIEGELIELQRIEKKKEKRAAKTYEELYALAMQRGYKNPHGWAKLQMNLRDRYRR